MKHRIIIAIAVIFSSLQFVGQASLSAQNKKGDECKMVIKVAGENDGVSLCISAAAEDMDDVWVDINNNGVREAGDSVRVCSSAGPAFYPSVSDSVVVYGKATELSTVFMSVIGLDVSQNPYLQSLDCRLNELKSLDVSANTNLTFLDCSYNYYMNTLNVANGNNDNLIVKANRTQLQCVQVDEGFVPSYQWEIANTSAWNNDSSNPCGGGVATALKLAQTNLSLNVGDKKILDAIAIPNYANPLSVNWTSSNNEVATVDANGTVVALSIGVAEITAQSKDGKFSATCVVEVDDADNYKMVLTTGKAIGKKLHLTMTAELEDRVNVWVDWNNNGIKEYGESLGRYEDEIGQNITLRKMTGVIASQKITIYGKVTHFDCSSQVVETLDVSANPELKNLECKENSLMQLDLSKNKKLVSLECGENKLRKLNIANGNNDKLLYLDTDLNYPYLTCIQIDDGYVPNNSGVRDWSKDDIASWNNDSSNPCGKAAISSFKLREKEVWLYDNGETKEMEIIILPFNANQIVKWRSTNPGVATVDATGLVTPISLGETKIIVESQDGSMSDTCLLKVENANDFKITFTTNKKIGEDIKMRINAYEGDSRYVWIDLNENAVKDNGEEFSHFYHPLKPISFTLENQTVTVYGKVRDFICENNGLTNLKIDSYWLETLDVNNNLLTELDVSKFARLDRLICSHNQLKHLDVSKSPYFTLIDCRSNQLVSLNVANGNNHKKVGQVRPAVFATDNPNLTCIQVDDGFIVPDNWSKDDVAIWNNDSTNPCDKTGINIVETKEITIFPNPTKEYLHIACDEKIELVQIYDMAGRKMLEEAGTQKISVANLPSGIYHISLVTDKKIYKQRFVKL